MTNEPTPETDAMFTENVPDDCQIVAFCERLEIQRNAARAERDEHIARNNDALLALHIATAERDEARAEIGKLRAELADERAKKSDALIAAVNDIERLRAALDLIATPMRIDGTYTIGRDECGIIARKALNTPAQ